MTTKYNKAWEDAPKYPQFASWIQRAHLDSQFRCKLCGGKDLNLGNMGQRALFSHLEGKKHAAIVSTMRSSSRLSLSGASSNTQPDINIALPTNAHVSEEHVVERMIVPNHVTEAEIRWALKIVQGHASFNSCNNLSEVFRVMFKDSEIATKFSLGPDKARYLICFGLAPFYMDTLIRSFFPCKFTLSFDEAFNKINHQAQLDLHVTFYDFSKKMVVRRYYDSVFLGHTSAVDLSEAMKKGLENLNWLSNLQSVSMDGPNVNWALLDILKRQMIEHDPSNPQILELGSCGLHVLHGAYGTAQKATNWNISGFLRSCYYLFNKSPARRADYLSANKVEMTQYDHSDHMFPLRFCGHRWLENSDVISRIIAILPSLKVFIEKAPKSATSLESFQIIKKALAAGYILIARLEFSRTISCELEPFLRFFQADKPLAVFLHEDLVQMMRAILTRFAKTTEIDKLTTGSKLISYDVSNGLLPARSIDIGFGASAAIKRIKTQQELDKLDFYKNCQSMLIALFKKITERSPLKYALTRAISALSPELMKSNPSRSTDRFKLLCEKLLESKHITSIQADAALKQFKSLLSVEEFKTAINNFDRNSHRVDSFFAEHIYDSRYQELWHIVLIVLKLGHGNAQVESGFSVNKDLLVPNLQQRSLVALRRVYDSIRGLNPASITVSQEMIKYARNAHANYEIAKSRDRENRSVAQKRALEKKALSEELRKLQSKRQKVASEIGTELSKIDSDILDLKSKLVNNM